MSRWIRWVADHPHNSGFTVSAPNALPAAVVQALSTRLALVQLLTRRFEAIVANLGRREAVLVGHSWLGAVKWMGPAVTFFLLAPGGHARESVTPDPGLWTPASHPAVPRHD